MTDKIAVVYIGPKEVKRDTLTGSRLLFPRLQPVDVECAIAQILLDHPTVWVRAENLAEVKAQAQKAAEEAAEQVRLKAEADAAAAEAACMVVGDVDLAKLTSAKLATLVEREDLGLQQDATEKVDDFRIRVRDALRAKQAAAEEGAE